MKLNRRQMMLMSAATCGAMGLGIPSAFARTTNLRYGHMNAPNSVAGQSADMFAEAVKRHTNGSVNVTVFPSSQLGKIQELAEATSVGTIAMTHNTAAGVGSLYKPFAVLDTPYLFRSVDHLMQVVDTHSPVMEKLNQGLIESSGVRVLYAFYFGTRQLTANKAARTPADLRGTKIRSIPFPIYMATVEGLGAVPVPIDWSEVPTALATGVVDGQENPVNVINSQKLYEIQSHMMLTSHIMGAEIVMINEDVWQRFDSDTKAAMEAAAEEVRQKSSQLTLDLEESDLADIRNAGMTVIGPDEGLDLEAFKAATKAIVQPRFDSEFREYYDMIDKIA
ncbi:TRAP transporter substrate-binding protein [Telmatospirillum sp. J64-1]|uniref:TRAP transporter substrate-binding protein n=1 Tax=Telmatospirillum sp. J64-1 TaxID=2502183 RepID=UPI00115E35CF|nr:TRAP transporter substrate-binding protein [Telmatospirillum sp. J64-1]